MALLGSRGGIAGGAGSTVLGVLAFLSYNLPSSGVCDQALQERPRPLCWWLCAHKGSVGSLGAGRALKRSDLLGDPWGVLWGTFCENLGDSCDFWGPCRELLTEANVSLCLLFTPQVTLPFPPQPSVSSDIEDEKLCVICTQPPNCTLNKAPFLLNISLCWPSHYSNKDVNT